MDQDQDDEGEKNGDQRCSLDDTVELIAVLKHLGQPQLKKYEKNSWNTSK